MENEVEAKKPEKRRKPAAPPPDPSESDEGKPANNLDWKDEKLVGTLARKFADSEAMPYAVWARVEDNAAYKLGKDEYDALVISWDTTLTLVGPQLPLGLIAGAMFLTAHLTPAFMRMIRPPENPDPEKAKKARAKRARIERAKEAGE